MMLWEVVGGDDGFPSKWDHFLAMPSAGSRSRKRSEDIKYSVEAVMIDVYVYSNDKARIMT